MPRLFGFVHGELTTGIDAATHALSLKHRRRRRRRFHIVSVGLRLTVATQIGMTRTLSRSRLSNKNGMTSSSRLSSSSRRRRPLMYLPFEELRAASHEYSTYGRKNCEHRCLRFRSRLSGIVLFLRCCGSYAKLSNDDICAASFDEL
jgi:hypothetical protein